MEMNDSEEKFNLIQWSPRDGLGDDHQAAKSYECNFCKRGFSNAQALGGHMNIHRRDRARFIGQLSSEDYPNQLASSDELTVVDHDYVRANSSDKEETLLQLERKGTNINSRNPSCYATTRSEDHEEAQAKLQIPLFLEEPIVSSENNNQGHANEGGKLVELDLELRLGPSETNLSTREFF